MARAHRPAPRHRAAAATRRELATAARMPATDARSRSRSTFVTAMPRDPATRQHGQLARLVGRQRSPPVQNGAGERGAGALCETAEASGCVKEIVPRAAAQSRDLESRIGGQSGPLEQSGESGRQDRRRRVFQPAQFGEGRAAIGIRPPGTEGTRHAEQAKGEQARGDNPPARLRWPPCNGRRQRDAAQIREACRIGVHSGGFRGARPARICSATS